MGIVESLLAAGSKISHETVRVCWSRIGPIVAAEMRPACSHPQLSSVVRENSSRSHCARDGHRFESPQLHHQEVGASGYGFPDSKIPRRRPALAGHRPVCGTGEGSSICPSLLLLVNNIQYAREDDPSMTGGPIFNVRNCWMLRNACATPTRLAYGSSLAPKPASRSRPMENGRHVNCR